MNPTNVEQDVFLNIYASNGVRVLIEERKNEIGRTIFEFLVDVETISRVGVAAYDHSSGMTEALSFRIERITYLSNI
ncbi:hypothetical protein V1477_000007 [Vespula maculifrons]|uniref:Uncharacterized protein n=1 Tax=Vespula maculifrons TaxID=7453 RepID=A0ABD2D2Z0_VESMC